MKVKEVMSQAYVTDKDITLEEASKIMSKQKMGTIMIVKDKKLIGMITERDLLRNFGENFKISKIMSKSLITISPEADLQEAFDMMNSHKIKRMPVVNKDELVGIIQATDLLLCADELDGEFYFN